MTTPFRLLPFSSRRGCRWLTLPAAWALVCLLLPLVLALSLWGAGVSTVYAETLDGMRVGTAYPLPTPCVDRDELAGVTNAEAGAQLPPVQQRMMQVFVHEAESRGITFCALSQLTRFSAVRAYVRLYPNSYQAMRLNNPPEDLIQMADDVLHHRLPDTTEGMGHFDGDGRHILFRP